MRGHTPSTDAYVLYRESLRGRPQQIGIPTLESGTSGWLRRAPGDASESLSATPTTSFEGIGYTDISPPDPDIAAGPEDLIQVVNSSIARFSKAGAQTSVMTLQQWFANVLPAACPNGSATCFIIDPTIRYDALHGRFLLSAFSEDDLLRTHFLLSVSNGSTYASGWKNWAMPGHPNAQGQPRREIDYPAIGYDNRAVYLTANMFDGSFPFDFLYAKLRIFKKSELYNPATATLSWIDIDDLRNADGSIAQSLRPAELRGIPGAPDAPGVLINAGTGPNSAFLTLWRIENAVSQTPRAVRTNLSNVWRYDSPTPFAQKDSVVRIDAGDARVLRAIVRGGVLYTARNSGYVDEGTTVTYDRIDLPLGRVSLQLRKVNGGFFFPAFNVPASHGMQNGFPSPLITGTNVDSLGSLTYAGVGGLKAGEDRFELAAPGSGVRWGDYFGAAIDPVDGGMWISGEFARPRGAFAGRWGTWNAYFPWLTVPQFSDVGSTNPFFSHVNVLKLWAITDGCQPGRYCPGAPVSRGQMAVFVIRSILGDSFPFPSQPYFTDVPATHPFFRYIQKLRELNITSGCSSTAYCPDRNVTRGEMAVFVIRGKLRSLFGDDFTFPASPFFTDVSAANSQFRFVQKMRELGITTGCSATSYCPGADVTREQIAAFVARAFLN